MFMERYDSVNVNRQIPTNQRLTMPFRSRNTCLYRGSRCSTIIALITGITLLVLISNFTLKPIIPHCLNYATSRYYETTRDHGGYDDISGIHDNISMTPSMYALPELGVYFHKAYYDGRQMEHHVRIFGIYRNDSKPDGFRCELNSTRGITWQVRAQWSAIDQQWPLYNKYLAFIMTCELPDPSIPRSVRLLSQDERHTIDMPVLKFQPMHHKRQSLAVCVKPITGQFPVARVLEWIEIHLAAGYGHFIMYDTDLQGAGRFALDYYKSKGVVTIMRFPFLATILEMAEKHVTLDGGLRYALYQQVYLMALHDCMYRFQPSFSHLAMVDLDEVILPVFDQTINDVMDKAQKNIPDVASYMFYTYWHFREFSKATSDVPDILYMQKMAWAPPATLDQPKSIINTDRVLTVNWHGVMEALNGTDIPRYLLSDWDYASVHHFRDGTCIEHFHALCHNMTSSVSLNKIITRYRHATEMNVKKVLSHLQL